MKTTTMRLLGRAHEAGWWCMAFGIVGAVFVMNFAYIPAMLVASCVVALMLLPLLILDSRGDGWRADHAGIGQMSNLLAMSVVLHAGRPMHVGMCLGWLVVWHCVPRSWLRPTASAIAASVATLAGFVPPAVYEWYGPSDELTLAYRLGCACVVVPFLIYTGVEDKESCRR